MLIPIKKRGFISSLCFHRNGADSGMLPVVLSLYSEQVHKNRFNITSYGDSDASEKQSGRSWNGSSMQLKDRSSERLDRYIQRMDGELSIIPMNQLHSRKRLKDCALHYRQTGLQNDGPMERTIAQDRNGTGYVLILIALHLPCVLMVQKRLKGCSHVLERSGNRLWNCKYAHLCTRSRDCPE